MCSALDKIKILRATGAGIADCKKGMYQYSSFSSFGKALDAENGDIDKAKEWLRKKGILKSSARQDKETLMGLIGLSVQGTSRVALVEVFGSHLVSGLYWTQVNSETDFVARNRVFQNLVNSISRAALELPPVSADVNLLLQVFSHYLFGGGFLILCCTGPHQFQRCNRVHRRPVACGFIVGRREAAAAACACAARSSHAGRREFLCALSAGGRGARCAERYVFSASSAHMRGFNACDRCCQLPGSACCGVRSLSAQCCTCRFHSLLLR